jgi:hypothetical protein
VDTAAASAPVPQPELAPELAPPPDLLPRRAATVAGLPLVLAALALGLGTDVAAWAAPWALVGAAPYLLGPRAGRMTALAAGCVALIVGPAALVGMVGGVVAGEGAARGLRPLVTLPLGLAGAICAAGTLGLAWS